jgi:predicted nucleotidyltransferase
MTFDELIKSFKVQPDLNRDIWGEDNKLIPKIKTALLNIAKNFYDGIELENKPPIKDIVFTGSLANYNWSRFSDIDLHLLFDFTEYGEHREAFEQLFLLAKSNWNKKHDVKVKGFDVEIYAEDQANPHHSTAVYSVMNDEWQVVPKKDVPVFDPLDVKSKVDYFISQYKALVGNINKTPPEQLLMDIEALRNKIAKFRKSGLEQGGEFSDENIAFKALRRIGLLDKLADLYTATTDKKLSVENRFV